MVTPQSPRCSAKDRLEDSTIYPVLSISTDAELPGESRCRRFFPAGSLLLSTPSNGAQAQVGRLVEFGGLL